MYLLGMPSQNHHSIKLGRPFNSCFEFVHHYRELRLDLSHNNISVHVGEKLFEIVQEYESKVCKWDSGSMY